MELKKLNEKLKQVLDENKKEDIIKSIKEGKETFDTILNEYNIFCKIYPNEEQELFGGEIVNAIQDCLVKLHNLKTEMENKSIYDFETAFKVLKESINDNKVVIGRYNDSKAVYISSEYLKNLYLFIFANSEDDLSIDFVLYNKDKELYFNSELNDELNMSNSNLTIEEIVQVLQKLGMSNTQIEDTNKIIHDILNV